MNQVRVGVVGLGNMGQAHVRCIQAGEAPGLVLSAVADAREESLAPYRGRTDVVAFAEAEALIGSDAVDAVIIATPHFSHTALGIAALQAGRHVLVEKPISVHKADAERLLAAHRDRSQVFAAMFNQRTDPRYLALRAMIRDGELGEIHRTQWTITDWFRTERYYASGGWRATWAGEGGGVLLNQCPHQLDLWQWLFGMPATVRGFCQYGRFHDIEVEDMVTAYLEYASGATGVFITTTGEAPGTNRLEVAADRGRVVIEGSRLQFIRNQVPAREFSRTSDRSFDAPPAEITETTIDGTGPQHRGILANFADAILHGAPLIATAHEGIHSVELANAILYSSHEGRPIEMPLDGAAYQAFLEERIRTSTHRKRVVDAATAADDFAASF
jgi:predicted dehydrogenase